MGVVKVLAVIIFLFYNLMFNVFQEKQVAKPSGENRIGIIELPVNLVYTENENYTQNVLIGNLFEGLVNKTASGNIEFAIAERFTVSEDGLTYKFYIRNNAYFSGGDKITSYDFVEFFNNIMENDQSKFYYKELKNIKGVKEFYKDDISFKEVGISAPSSKYLQIDLKEKDDKLLQNLSKDKFSLRRNFKYLENYKDFYEYIDYSGAYYISNIESIMNENEKIILKSNKYYFSNNFKTVKEKLYSFVSEEEVVLEVFPTRELALSAYEIGKLDFLLDVSYNNVENYYDSNELYYVYNDDVKLIFNSDTFKEIVVETDGNIDESEEVSLNVNDEKLEEEIIEEQKLQKGNFINLIIDRRDIRYINGVTGEYLNNYEFDMEYIADMISKFSSEDIKRVKIITHSDDNFIELAKNFREFLKVEFDIESNIIALDEDYIENSLEEDEYDILISDLYKKEDELSLDFDKPNIILSKHKLSKEQIDGNGTILIHNMY